MTQLPPGQGPIDPQNAFRSGPPPIPGMMPPFLPPPPPPRRKVSIASALVVAFVTIVFSLSLLLNLILIITVASINGDDASGKTKTLVSGGTSKVAVVPVNGIILGKQAETFSKILDRLDKESSVKALVIQIDTPGGDVSASDEMYHRLMKFKADHSGVPVVISMGGLATSGGYYLACAGDYIFAQPTTLTANIGVLMPRYNLSQLADKYGIKDSTLKSSGSPYKDAGSMLKPEDPVATAYMQNLIDQCYVQFKNVVKTGRGTQIQAKGLTVDQIADGRALIASDAIAKGLVDQTGYLEDAYQHAATMAALTKPSIIKYEERGGLMDLFASSKLSTPTPQGTSLNIDRDLVESLISPRVMYLWTGTN